MMRYVVIGAGAVGGLIAARLNLAGHEVALVARGNTAEVLAQKGLQLSTPEGVTHQRLPVHRHPRSVGLRKDDAVIMAVKTQDTAAAVQDLAGCAPSEIAVFCAQNGLENERLALRMFPRVFGMFVFVFGACLAPGEVSCYTAPGAGVVDLGRFPQGSDHIAVHAAKDLNSAGFDSTVRNDILRWKAGKLLANLGNALTACYGDSSAVPDLLEAAQAEGRACLAAIGQPFATSDEMLARRRHLLPLKTVQGRKFPGSSSWQSLARGASVTEVDYLTGEIVLLGRLHGIPTPVNDALQAQVGRMARDRQQPGSLDPDALRSALGLPLPTVPG